MKVSHGVSMSDAIPFTVLMSVYSKEKAHFLNECLNSITQQTRVPSEVVLVADGQLTKPLYKMIEKYRVRLKIRLFQLDRNYGAGYALNHGMENCNFNLVAKVDSDDICFAERFEVQIAFLTANPEVSLVGSHLTEFGETPGDSKVIKKVPTDSSDIARFSKFRNPINHPSVMFRKSHVMDSGSYQSMHFFEDYYLWIRMLNKGYKLSNLDTSLVYFRSNAGAIERRRGLSYAKHEIHFLRTLAADGFISKWHCLVLLVQRIPIRLMPTNFVTSIYRFILRH